MAKLSEDLNYYFFEEERQEKVNLAQILALAKERGFGFLLVMLSLPSALPIPAPGYATPFGLMILFLAFQLIIGLEQPWLPQFVLRGSISLEKAQMIIQAGLPWLKKIENLTKPRFSIICKSLPGRMIIGLVIALMAISMIIPLPLTNTLPAIGVFVTAFSLIEDDGLICLGGFFLCLCGATLTSSILFLIFFLGKNVDQAVEMIKSFLRNLFN